MTFLLNGRLLIGLINTKFISNVGERMFTAFFVFSFLVVFLTIGTSRVNFSVIVCLVFVLLGIRFAGMPIENIAGAILGIMIGAKVSIVCKVHQIH